MMSSSVLALPSPSIVDGGMLGSCEWRGKLRTENAESAQRNGVEKTEQLGGGRERMPCAFVTGFCAPKIAEFL